MPKLPVVSPKQIIKVPGKLGFQNAPKKGKGICEKRQDAACYSAQKR